MATPTVAPAPTPTPAPRGGLLGCAAAPLAAGDSPLGLALLLGMFLPALGREVLGRPRPGRRGEP
ncbi:MAG: hypothetical protein HY687_02370 [Chloroflexi bacterium]|nr:hypothetical protein [Chloroflexota bacterium]